MKKPTETPSTIRRIKLKKLNNTRDLGGIPAADGQYIKRGKLFRSGKLYSLKKSDKRKLGSLGLTKIIDLRIDNELIGEPCDNIAGCEVVHIPLICTATIGITHEKRMVNVMVDESKTMKKEYGSTLAYMCDMYKKMLFLPDSQHSLSRIMRIIIDNDGGTIWCCGAGKDRTGIIAMLIEGLLGVSEELIIKDYVASDKFQFVKRTWQKIGLHLLPISRDLRRFMLAMMRADVRYINYVLQIIKESFGSIENYCKSALGITESDLTVLRSKYLVNG